MVGEGEDGGGEAARTCLPGHSDGRPAEDVGLCHLGAQSLPGTFTHSPFLALRATDDPAAFAGCPFPERGQAWPPLPALLGKGLG